jgi:hypothetical protein
VGEDMTINEENKRVLIQNIRKSIRNGDDLEVELLLKGKNEEAEKIRKKTDELVLENKALIAALMKEWLGTVAEIEGNLQNINAGLKAVIQDIKGDIEIAQNVVKAVGYIDDAIGIATKLLKYV